MGDLIMAQKWEYQVLDYRKLNYTELGIKLSELGKNGWEIAVGLNNGQYGTTTGIILKRPEDEKFHKVTKEMGRQAELQINEEEWPDVAYPRK